MLWWCNRAHARASRSNRRRESTFANAASRMILMAAARPTACRSRVNDAHPAPPRRCSSRYLPPTLRSTCTLSDSAWPSCWHVSTARCNTPRSGTLLQQIEPPGVDACQHLQPDAFIGSGGPSQVAFSRATASCAATASSRWRSRANRAPPIASRPAAALRHPASAPSNRHHQARVACAKRRAAAKALANPESFIWWT